MDAKITTNSIMNDDNDMALRQEGQDQARRCQEATLEIERRRVADTFENPLDLIPRGLLPGIVQYVQHGVMPGGFLRAVFANDLFSAFARADTESRAALFYICQFVYNSCPGNCHGSWEIVNQWNEAGGYQGRRGQAWSFSEISKIDESALAAMGEKNEQG